MDLDKYMLFKIATGIRFGKHSNILDCTILYKTMELRITVVTAFVQIKKGAGAEQF